MVFRPSIFLTHRKLRIKGLPPMEANNAFIAFRIIAQSMNNQEESAEIMTERSRG